MFCGDVFVVVLFLVGFCGIEVLEVVVSLEKFGGVVVFGVEVMVVFVVVGVGG